MNMQFLRKLPIPKDIKGQYPVSAAASAKKKERDEEIARILQGKSQKRLIIVGPCSADREDAVFEYVCRLAVLQEKVKERFLLIPRVYTTKPRTTGDGYKGMLHQPIPTEGPDLLQGLIATRHLHIRILEETGLSAADEMLYPEDLRYFNDVLSYVTVGARSVEDQQHRLTASGLTIPVGMKNPLSGDINNMLNAVHAAQQSHRFIYRGWEVTTAGNPLAHAVLRGFINKEGENCPNYSLEHLQSLVSAYRLRDCTNPAVIVDTSHGNSDKCWEKQPDVAFDVLKSCEKDATVQKSVRGFMIESYLVDGNQTPEESVYGKSITDGCMGWKKTERLILTLADLS